MRLNAEQREAVEHGEGPLLVLAGAGSGKTRVITARIARLVGLGAKPESILAVTFTNKAAREMRDRVGRIVGPEIAKALWLSTFHRFGVRFVREESKTLGLGSRFSIFDQGDSLGVIRQLLRGEVPSDRRLDAQAVASRLSLWKGALLEPDEVRAKDDEYDQAALSIYAQYEQTLQSMHAVDFDDLIVKPVKLLRDDPETRERWTARFSHILVDEFQDTSQAQLDLVRLLVNRNGNLCVVGDDDQSIYGWRGARVENILDFERYFPGASVATLDRNYRSRAAILSVANAAIGQAPKRRYAKTLKPTRDGGKPVRVCVLPEPSHEAKFVASEIRSLRDKGVSLGEIAVLYRSNTQAKLLEEELRIEGVPYRVYGGTRLFDRKEIKDGVAYLRATLNPRDDLSLRRIINTPPRGLGAQSVKLLAEHADRAGISLSKALTQAAAVSGLSARARDSAARFGAAIESAHRGFHTGAFAQTAATLFSSTGMLAEGDDAHLKARRANLEFLLQSIGRLEKRSRADRDALQQLLHTLSLDTSDEPDNSDQQEVTLSSLHSAKGLEFSVVFLIGCVEGILPHSRTTDPKITDVTMADLEEERRLFYVGVTRAKDLLYLTRSKERLSRGRLSKLTPSRFLQGLPSDDVEVYERAESQEMGRAEVADMAKALLDRLGSTA